MNKSALKTFATNARKELLKKVEAKAMKIGITEDNIKKADVESSDAIFIDGRQLSKEEKTQRDKLIARINQIGFKQVMEEVAYTWFNRFTALRFMEVNDYLPSGVRVLSSSNPNSADPDMLNEALELDLEVELDKEHIYNLKLNNETEELFKYLIIKHCNDLNRYLPFMFETIDDYTEILFPEGLLVKDSFIRQMTDSEFISEEDWEKVEIIGWLYQYYNNELNELVYDGNLSKSRVSKELLPAATQLFTPDWAVKYMVENSLGRLWLEGNANDNLKENWKYYLEQVEETNNTSINSQYSQQNPEEIKILDPCMGSGHILVYAFDVLMDIYKSCGYIPRDATKLILQKNLYGLEIEDRAYQLACFSLVMKARKYNRRIFDEKIELNLCSINESNKIGEIDIERTINLEAEDIKTANYLISIFKNAKEYGSILNIEKMNYESLNISLMNNTHEVRDLFQLQLLIEVDDILPKLIKQAQIMSQKYEIVITNPPYLGNSRMSLLLDEYVKMHFPSTKSDLSMVMYQKAIESYSKSNGFISYMTTASWMFLKSFEEFRMRVLENLEFCSLVDFGTELFDGKVGHNHIVSWVNRNSKPIRNMIAMSLVEFCFSRRNEKEIEFFNFNNRFYPSQHTFTKIPGSPIAYWASEQFLLNFGQEKLSDMYNIKLGISPGNTDYFLKLWHEVDHTKIGFNFESRAEASNSSFKWFPCNKGGSFNKWYGNREFIMNWENDGFELRNYKDSNGKLLSRPQNLGYQFLGHIAWTRISPSKIAFRYFEDGFMFTDSSAGIFDTKDTRDYIIAFLNTVVCKQILGCINPTMNYQVGDISKVPIIIDDNLSEIIKKLAKENIKLSKDDFDSFELSWDFKKHPLLVIKVENTKIENAFEKWESIVQDRFIQLKGNEEELNKLFIKIYDLEGEILPNVSEDDVSINRANKERDIKSFISYAIGCIFGRYSLDEEGLIYAGGEFDIDRYSTFKVDKDNILPILSGAYFEDDIVSMFIEFVKVSFGELTLAENLDFIADTLGKKKGETAKETIRRYFLNDFFKNHIQTYKKRPIYWLFTSGKQKAFNCLIYMHRYDKTTLSRIRTDYLHEYQIRLDAEKKDLLSVIEGDYTAKEISNAKKELKVLDKKIEELKEYDELLHHMADMQIDIDLDDGVAVNSEKFRGLVAKI